MRIDRLTVQNFKGFEHREFTFHPQMNLLVGVNGTGKTSVLDALAVAAGSWFLGLRGYDSRHIKAEEVRLKAIQPSNGPGRNGQPGPPVNWEYQYPSAIEASGEVLDHQLTWRRSLNKPKGRTWYVQAKEIKQLGGKADDDVRAGVPIVLPLVSYYGTGRLWNVPNDQPGIKTGERLIRKEQRSRLMGYRRSLDPRVSVSDLTHWIAVQSWIAYQHAGTGTAGYSAARAAILGCMDGAKDLYFDAGRGEVIVEIGDHGKQPFRNLSDGQRALLALVGDLAQKAITLNPALEDRALAETPGIVLIDELDLHLHPIWQRSVIEHLRTTFSKIQFFATTHSPFLIQSLRSGEELLMLEGVPTAQLANKTVAEIARGIMGVDPEVSERYNEMKETATDFLETLEKAATAPSEKLAEFQDKLSESIAPYADNPAFQAFLEMKRAAKLSS
jgi:predicted ATP-binding protein involved in virulence